MAVPESRAAEYRYGVVFLLVFALVVFTIVTPDGPLPRAIAFSLIAAAFIVAVSTSRERSSVRHRRTLIGTAAAAAIAVLLLTDVLGRGATFGLVAVLAAIVPVTLGGGLLRLVREHGATVQAVAGALAIYLSVGLTFAAVIGFAATVGPTYFAQGIKGTTSQHVYYSFTVLTTTGFGDLTAAHSFGRAMAVIEMLVGQIYLVTVIGILISRRAGSLDSK